MALFLGTTRPVPSSFSSFANQRLKFALSRNLISITRNGSSLHPFKRTLQASLHSGLKTLSDPKILAIPIPIPTQCMIHHIRPHYLTIGKQFQNTRKLIVYAKEQKNGDENELSSKESANPENRDGNEKEQAPFFKLRWTDLVLDPDPDNVLAVGLTGLLTWASVQVVWQLLAVSFAIVIAALKYSFVAALLIFILVALL